MKKTTKKALAIVLTLCLCIGMIPFGMATASADVDEGGSNQGFEVPTPQNVQATLIGFVEATTGKALVVEISWDAMSEIDGGNKFVEMWPTLKQDENLNLPMSFDAWLGQATLIPVEELQEGTMGYVTKDGRSTLRSVVHILQPGDLKVDENGMATGVKENDVVDIDLYTAGYDPATQTDAESEHKHVEIVYTEENVRNKKTFTEVGGEECNHQNTEENAETDAVQNPVAEDGKISNVIVIKETETCKDCSKKKTSKITRIKFKNRVQLQRYLYGKKAKLKNGKKVHFNGKYEKIEKVYWKSKTVKISRKLTTRDYIKSKGSVELEFTDEFLGSVGDGEYELTYLCDGEFIILKLTVENHLLTEIDIPDSDDFSQMSNETYDELMKDSEAEDVALGEIDLDEIPIIGDVNRDGSVDVLDAADVQKYSTDKLELDKNQLMLADVNNDNNVDVLDAADIQKFAVDKITEFKKIV